jgi:hypothetical protein
MKASVVKGQWMEEYKHCSCSFVAEKKEDLPGYCAKHGNSRNHLYKLPRPVKVGGS